MWYEILPSAAVILGGVTLPPIFAYFLSKFQHNGNPYRRDLQTNLFDLGLYRRDMYLHGNPYIMKGLENIPDSE